MNIEWLKLRRTLVWPIVLGLPWLPGILNWLIFRPRLNRPEADWADVLRNGQQLGFLLLLPLLFSLLVAQVVAIEQGQGGWRLMFASPQSRRRTVLNKLGVLLCLTGVMVLVQSVAVACSALLLQGSLSGSADWAGFIGHGATGLLASFALLLITLAVALRFPSFLAPLGLGMASTVITFVALNSEYGRWWPWALPAYSVVTRLGELAAPLAWSAVLALLSLAWIMWETQRREA